jgi:hypothetical protein
MQPNRRSLTEYTIHIFMFVNADGRNKKGIIYLSIFHIETWDVRSIIAPGQQTGSVFLGRATISPGQKIVAANFRNRISMQPMRSQASWSEGSRPYYLSLVHLYLVYSQVWLNISINDHHFGYITKLH